MTTATPRSSWLVVLAAVLLSPALAGAAETTPAGGTPAASALPSAPDLSFDLFGDTKPPQVAPLAPEISARLALRRTMLTWHQGLGMALVTAMTATVVVGQLNYNDRFGGGPSTGRYEQPHTLLAVGTSTLFVATGLLGVLAPVPLEKPRQGFDRITLHKLALFTATAAMAAEIGLGIYTTQREGYLNQKDFATAHLVLGYATAAALALGVGAIVF